LDLKDAVLAAEAGVQGIVLSNHGGRQLEVRVLDQLSAERVSVSCDPI
jgi:isopentenyl diphosphate isomerase/L-lactate dehydrogenase-like FMN-dependent dehydrogenase